MLTKQFLPHGIVVYQSPLLRAISVRHAFSTRAGGVSPAPFASMNLGNPNGESVQDDYDRIWQNYRLLQQALGMPVDDKPCRVHQVHGNIVTRAVCGQSFDSAAKADAIVSDDPTRVLSVRVADCVPVLLANEDGRTVAAVHAGWRGVASGIVPKALAFMRIDPRGCIAAIGPCIGLDAFEVGPEVVNEFRRAFGNLDHVRQRDDGKGHVDLRAAVGHQLRDSGVPTNQIDSTDRCTFRDADEFYSHRRDNGVTGRMAALIQCNG